ncbi:MAG: SRPBCC family protein [Pseudomonadota bacterium]
MFKKIVFVIVALIAAFVIYVAMQPSEYRVERSITIAAQPGKVFENVNDFHKWQAWSPWADLDPNAKITFEGAEAGKGAIMKWDGDDTAGEGQMTLVESDPDKAVKIKVEFTRPFEGGTNSDFAFSPEGGGTEVVWALHGSHDFMGKLFTVMMDGLGMMGNDLEKGLSQLKSAVEQG